MTGPLHFIPSSLSSKQSILLNAPLNLNEPVICSLSANNKIIITIWLNMFTNIDQKSDLKLTENALIELQLNIILKIENLES